MTGKDIKVGGKYVLRLSTGRFTVVEVKRETSGGRTKWQVMDCGTKRIFGVVSAAKFRRAATAGDEKTLTGNDIRSSIQVDHMHELELRNAAKDNERRGEGRCQPAPALTVTPPPPFVPMNKTPELSRVSSMELDMMNRVAKLVKVRGETLIAVARYPGDKTWTYIARVSTACWKLFDLTVDVSSWLGDNDRVLEARYIGG